MLFLYNSCRSYRTVIKTIASLFSLHKTHICITYAKKKMLLHWGGHFIYWHHAAKRLVLSRNHGMRVDQNISLL